MTVEASALSLRQLLPLSLEERAKLIMAHGAMDLARSVRTLEQDGLTVPKNLRERIAWALAWNVSIYSSGSAKKNWNLDTAWPEVWGLLTRPFKGSSLEPGRVRLDELALWVLCEQQQAWQPTGSGPLDPDLADAAVGFIYERDKGKVVGFLRKQFGNRAGEPEEHAHNTWAEVLANYWGPQAHLRFRGLSRISSFVCDVAMNVAIEAFRAQKKQVSWEELQSNSGEKSAAALRQWIKLNKVEVDPGEQVMMEELRRRLDECMQALSNRQQPVARRIWLQGESAKAVAEDLDVSESAISQQMKKARESVRGCLERHGYQIHD